MATVTVPQKVDNPVVPRVRPRGLLSDLAYPVNASRWQAGVTFVGYDATNIPEVVEHDWCTPDDVDGVPADSEIPAFQAFSVWDTEVCSTLAVDPAWLLDRTNHRVNLWTSFFLARELMTGSVTGNMSLQAAATVVSGTHSPVAALLRLEADWAAAFGNQRADIHINPALMVALSLYLSEEETEISTEVINDDGSVTETDIETITGFTTPSGHRVIFDAGYGNIEPGGSTDGVPNGPGIAGGADNLWIYASGPVAAKVGATENLSADGSYIVPHNDIVGRSYSMGLVVFDPDTVLAVEVDITDAKIGA